MYVVIQDEHLSRLDEFVSFLFTRRPALKDYFVPGNTCIFQHINYNSCYIVIIFIIMKLIMHSFFK